MFTTVPQRRRTTLKLEPREVSVLDLYDMIASVDPAVQFLIVDELSGSKAQVAYAELLRDRRDLGSLVVVHEPRTSHGDIDSVLDIVARRFDALGLDLADLADALLVFDRMMHWSVIDTRTLTGSIVVA